MIVTFNVGNYRSFKQVVTFTMMSAKLTSKNKELDKNNVFPVSRSISLLKSAAIYGANASGKSNLLKAMVFMRQFVLTSSAESLSTSLIPVERFRLSTETESKPSYFEIVFFLEDTMYRYGFEVDQNRVHSEWLYHKPNQREIKLFIREGKSFDLSNNNFKEGIGLDIRTRDNALFLSTVAQFNGSISQSILNWFKDINVISGLLDDLPRYITFQAMENDFQQRQDIISFIKQLDLGISDIQVKKLDPVKDIPNNLPEEIKNFIKMDKVVGFNVKTIHKKYDDNNTYTSDENFDIAGNESDGTQKLFSLSGPLMRTLKTGKVLIVDELDTRFHPLMTMTIINLFNSNITNPKNAQLIFATHDINLLNRNVLRRDQIWFTEKDQYGATDLYSLVEYRARNDASFEKDYMSGKYGAIPFIGDASQLVGGTNVQDN